MLMSKINSIQAKYYAYVMSNLRFDKYVNGQHDYVVEHIYLKPLRKTLTTIAIHDIELYFHERCILILDGIWYGIDEPCMVPISKGTPYQVRNLYWFHRMLYTVIYEKKQM